MRSASVPAFGSWPAKVALLTALVCTFAAICVYRSARASWARTVDLLRPEADPSLGSPEDSTPVADISSEELPEEPAGGVKTAEKHWRDDDVRYEGIIHPRDVFLWYTKGEKTGSTVAATLIAHAYEAANLTIVNNRDFVKAGAPGAYAAVCHQTYSDQLLNELRTLVNRPVLLVVSIREGRDWIISNAFRAERATSRRFKLGGCESLWQGSGKWKGPNNMCKNYSLYVPASGSNAIPWWVLRHEHIVEDTCAMLSRLGLVCNPNLATGQVSRKDLSEDLLKCEVQVEQEDVDCINALNKKLWDKAPPR